MLAKRLQSGSLVMILPFVKLEESMGKPAEA
jgi:hypothetical protein